MRVVEWIEARGHPNITAENRTTFEVTREDQLTLRGDCVIAIHASKGTRDLNEKFKQLARRKDAKITAIVEVGTYKEIAVGVGNPQLTFTHPTDLVARKSSYVCNRTFMLAADKAAKDFSRELIREAQNHLRRITVTLVVEV